MNIEPKQFKQMAELFEEQQSLECFASYLHELKKHYDFTYGFDGGDLLTAEASNVKMKMTYHIDLTLHKGRLQVRERTFRDGVLIGNTEHLIQLGQTVRREYVLQKAFPKLALFSK